MLETSPPRLPGRRHRHVRNRDRVGGQRSSRQAGDRGMKLGKELALALQPMLEGRASAGAKDGSTRALIAFLTA